MLFHEYGILLKNPFLYCSPVMKFMLLNMTLKNSAFQALFFNNTQSSCPVLQCFDCVICNNGHV